MSNTIKPGQRWYSKTETELGLGLVLSLEERFVKIFYPEANETRTYNPKSSPLQRFQLNVGDKITLKDEQSYTIKEIKEEDSILFYLTEKGEVNESEINSKIDLVHPEDKLFSGLIDSSKEYHFKYEAYLTKRKIEQLKYRGLYSSKVGLIPHQSSIHATLIDEKIKKFILCDEVGLGKTIESLNYLKYLIETELVESVLILTPQSLQYQWFIELYRKYNLFFKTFGIDDIVELESEFDNDNFIISSPAHLNENQADKDFITNKKFDLIIIDEAHQIDYKNNAFIQNIIHEATYATLLTATPEALGKDSFQSMQEVLNTKNNVYFRNRREILEKSYKLFPKKELILKPINEKISSDTQALKAKVAQILDTIDDTKTLIITHSKDQARKIKKIIEEVNSCKIALFHSEMELMERDRQVAYFQDPAGANLLICTEVGSEGRNFEFASKLILMDIPLNPTQLIQRIGRLDRIGQKNNFKIIVPFVENSFEENILNFYQQIDIFHTFPKGITLYYERIKEELHEALKNNDLDKIKMMAKNYEMFRDDQNVAYSEIDQFSYQSERYDSLLNEVQNLSIDPYQFLNRFCDLIHLDFEDLNEEVFSIRATQNMLITLPGLSFDGKMYTLNRELALVRDDIALFSIEDPLFKNILDFITLSEYANCACVKSQYKGIELIFNSELENSTENYKNYFPLIPIRVFLDLSGNDQTKKIPKKLLDETSVDLSQEEKEYLGQNMPKETIINLVKKAKLMGQKRLNDYLDKELNQLDTEVQKYIRENIRLQTAQLRLVI